MAGVADKARYYLERSVPQLREWEEKEIFTKDEIRNIVKKRDAFEHRVLSPGNRPSDWSAYAQYEQSLELLRSKRCKRLKIHHLTSGHTGQMVVLAIYQRGVGRHAGSSALWKEYLQYAAKVGASKRFRKAMTDALRMLPTDPQLWVLAGRRSAESGDMGSARGFFMRGCRFCNRDAGLWLEYARCEMDWLVKMEKKRAKDNKNPLITEKADAEDELRLVGDSDDEDEEDENGLIMPQPNATQANVIDKQDAKSLASNPALDGAIPTAIFDISRKQSFFTASTASTFFELFASYRAQLPNQQQRISSHVLSTMDESFPRDPCTSDCHVRESIIGVDPHTAEFPQNLRTVLKTLGEQMEVTSNAAELRKLTVKWVDSYLAIEDLDEDIKTVLEVVKKQQLEAS